MFQLIMRWLSLLVFVALPGFASGAAQKAEVFFQAGIDGRLIPYTRDGKALIECHSLLCQDQPLPPSIDQFAVSFAEFSTVGNSSSDGNCTVIWVFITGIGWVPYYDPDDPDCPP